MQRPFNTDRRELSVVRERNAMQAGNRFASFEVTHFQAGGSTQRRMCRPVKPESHRFLQSGGSRRLSPPAEDVSGFQP